MMTVVHADKNDPVVQEALRAYAPGAGYNDLPLNFEEITEADLVKSTLWGHYQPVALDLRQSKWKGSNGREYFMGFHMYHFHDGTGVAMTTDYWNAPHVRWFRFGCKHKYTELSVEECRALGYPTGRCLHTSRCSICGHVNTVDSSD